MHVSAIYIPKNSFAFDDLISINHNSNVKISCRNVSTLIKSNSEDYTQLNKARDYVAVF